MTATALESRAIGADRNSFANPLVGERRREFLRDETLAEIFEATVSQRTDKVGIIEGDRILTYGAVNAEADRMAAGLVHLGAGPGAVIGLYMARGADLLIAQIAIAKTGAAWLPFDAETPSSRIAVCLQDAGAIGVLTSQTMAERLQAAPCPVWINTDRQVRVSAGQRAPAARQRGLTPAHPAYLIYTSGSTGTPKGIVVSHRNICHYLRASNAVYGIRAVDRVFQSCSVAFDLSMEEIWVPYLVGATLWVATTGVLGDAEALPATLRGAGITVLDTVPTLLAMIGDDVPTLRIVILGGEACPPALVERFAKPGRKVFNSYGPTEATVVATIAELVAGEHVNIGQPIPNYTAYVADETMVLVGQDVQGELLIGGPGVTLGYLKRNDLTAQKFIANPFSANHSDPILYRTGDSVSVGADGAIAFHGRIDDQVKIRGFRVELGEIEQALTDHPAVKAAAVTLRSIAGIDQLVAHLVMGSPDIPVLREALKERLPAYMVPARFEVLDELPRLISGKVDRKALVALPLTTALETVVTNAEPAADGLEAALLVAAAEIFPGQPISPSSDFFNDLGGHSLLAAQWVSKVRQIPAHASIMLKDVYSGRNLRGIANLLRTRIADDGPAEAPRPPFTPPSLQRRFWCGLAQAATMPFLLTLQAAPWLGIFITYALMTTGNDPWYVEIAKVLAVYMAITLAMYVIMPAAKWAIMGGRTKPGRYPLWGQYYYRVWLTHHLMTLVHLKWMQSTPVLRFYLRLLGAKVGREAIISEIDAGAIDLLTIGDHASIGGKVVIANARVEGSDFIIGPVSIGADVSIGNSCVIENDVTIGVGAELADLTAVRAGLTIPAWEAWAGSPAIKIRDLNAADLPAPAAASSTRRFAQTLVYAVLLVVLPPIALIPIVPAFHLIESLDTIVSPMFGDINYLWYMPLLAIPAAMLMILFTVLFIAAIRWTVLPRVRPGRYSIHSWFAMRKWVVGLATEVMLDTLSSLFATVYMRSWYRLMGAKIGKGSEISTNLSARHDLIDIGEGNFVADDVQLGDEDVRRGWMTLDTVKTGSRVFIGNEAVVPQGTIIESGALIGVKSRIPDSGHVSAGETWFGSPAMQLPVRQTFAANAALTFEPPRLMKIWRAVFEAFNISLPTALFIWFASIGMDVLNAPVSEGQWGYAAFLAVVISVVIAFAQFAVTIAAKWISMGVYKPTIKPMWSWWALRTEAVAVMYWGMAGKALLEQLRGTPFLPWCLRLYGVKIGKGVYMDSTDITEFDCVTIGDFAVINNTACLQTHLYEDRMMKVGRIKVGTGVTVGSGSTVLYDTVLGDHAELGPLTLVMKGESLPANSAWVGSPAQPAHAAAARVEASLSQPSHQLIKAAA